jgi:hypothetical protein
VPSQPPPQQADTGAAPQQPTAAQIALHAAELYALEQAAARLISLPLRTCLVRIQRDAAAKWIREFGSLTAPADPIRLGQVIAGIQRDLADITPDATGPLSTWAARALDLGIQQGAHEAFGTTAVAAAGTVATAAAETAALATVPTAAEPAIAGAVGSDISTTIARATTAATLDDQTLRTIAGADSRIADRITAAENALNAAGPAFDDVTQALAGAHRAATDMQAAVVQVVNGAANTGITAVADSLGAQRLWWAEPDACLTCIGMAGRLADPGEPFDQGFAATFTPKPRIWPPGPIQTCPLHPHCRCRVTVWLGSDTAGTDLPAALRREAQRAVLKGWSLPSESNPARVQAAQQLLNRGVTAPKSGQAYARAAVRRGRFTTRTVPAPPSRKRPSTP